jgi:hypothetical protein
MKYEFSYWDNNKQPDSHRRFFTIVLDKLDILEADKQLEEQWGINPIKKMSIGCQIKKIDE